MPLQPLADIEQWYQKYDPWDYETSFDDKKRKDILLAELPLRAYKHVLDIGCGHGFVTRDLPGENILGIDISAKAIQQAQHDALKRKRSHLAYATEDLFALTKATKRKYDLILITGVLYPQYIGEANTLVYTIIDELLSDNGILVSVHISDWYTAQFPYLKHQDYFYNYRTYTHRLEIYIK